MLPLISAEMRVVADPELRFSPSGVAVATVRLVSNSRKQVNGEWVDDKVCWMRATAFKATAENLVESVAKGDLVTVTGKLSTEEWEKDGEKKSATVMVIDSIGTCLAFASAKPVKADRTAASSSSQSQPASDPWSSSNTSDDPGF